MARLSKTERDKRQSGSLAEEFRLTREAKFKHPSLEQMYWKNPNEPRGDIATCKHDISVTPAVGPYLYSETHRSEGI